MNSLYKSMNPAPQPNTIDHDQQFRQNQAPQPNIMDQYQQFRQNPMQFLMQRSIGVPQQFQNNPYGAVQYLMSNGQMSQQQFQRCSQIAQAMGVKL